MLVLLTAAMSEGRRPEREIASRMHSQMSAQLRVVSKTCEPGEPGSEACDHSRWPVATWFPARSKMIARQLPVPRPPARRPGSGMGGSLPRRVCGLERGTIRDVDEPIAGGEPRDLRRRHLPAAAECLAGGPA